MRRAAPSLCGLAIGGLSLSVSLRADEPPLWEAAGGALATVTRSLSRRPRTNGRAPPRSAPGSPREGSSQFFLLWRRTVRRPRPLPPLARSFAGWNARTYTLLAPQLDRANSTHRQAHFLGAHRRRGKPANSAPRRPDSPASHPLAAPNDGAPMRIAATRRKETERLEISSAKI